MSFAKRSEDEGLEDLKIVWQEGEGYYEEKKSRFISYVVPATTEEEAVEFVNQIKKKHWDARHHCYGLICGNNRELMRFSDDGEPQGTAGKPILEVMMSANVTDVLVVVVRYFGGTLLGTGGLVRAYTKSAQDGLLKANLIERKRGIRLLVTTDYTLLGKVNYIDREEGVFEENQDFREQVTLQLVCPLEQKEDFCNKLTEATAAKVKIEEGEEILYGIADGSLQLLSE